MAFVSTPRRSPRLAAIRSNSITVANTTTPIRDRLQEATRSTPILGETKRFIDLVSWRCSHSAGQALSKNSISTSETSLIQNLVTTWAIHTPSL